MAHRISLSPLASLVPAALLLPAAAFASEPGEGARRAFDLSPERIAAFEAALRDLASTTQAMGSDLYLRARYQPANARSVQPASLAISEAADDVRPGHGRDLVFEENVLMAGREDEYLDAARTWAARWLKGSDAAAAGRHRGFVAGWDHGPTAGWRAGPVSLRAGWNGDWRVRHARALRSHPGWELRAWIGVEDGDETAAITIGRSLRASRHR